MELSIENAIKAQTQSGGADYPFAKLNADQSVSLFLCQCGEANCKACDDSNQFKEALNVNYIVDQLDYHRQKFGFPLVGNKKQLLEPTAIPNGMEYRLNLAPEQLDALLKLNSTYNGYKAENSLLKLMKKATLKPGVISLFPILPLDDHQSLIRTAGCQTIEIPSIQLLHLLPGFDGKEGNFHYVPKKVTEELSIDSRILNEVINTILIENEMRSSGSWLNPQQMSGYDIIANPKANNTVNIVEMDDNVRHFYNLYGNLGVDELEQCKSVEIDRVEFLEQIANAIKKKETSLIDEPQKSLEKKKIETSLNLLQKMIETAEKEKAALEEKQKKVESVISPTVTSAADTKINDFKSSHAAIATSLPPVNPIPAAGISYNATVLGGKPDSKDDHKTTSTPDLSHSNPQVPANLAGSKDPDPAKITSSEIETPNLPKFRSS